MNPSAHDRPIECPTERLLACGAAAAVVFVVSSVVQGASRQGFNLSRQPVSFLMLDGLGWLERLTFLVAAALVVAFAAGVRRLTADGRRPWSAIFLVGLGIGMAVAGLFPPDAGFAYPPSTPAGPPVHLTYHSTMHGVGFTLSIVCFVAVSLITAVAAFRIGQKLMATYSCLSAVAVLVLGMTPGTTGIAIRDLFAAILLWLWIAVLSVRMSRRRTLDRVRV